MGNGKVIEGFLYCECCTGLRKHWVWVGVVMIVRKCQACGKEIFIGLSIH